MQQTCRSCGLMIPDAHIDVSTATATCPGCQAVFYFRHEPSTPASQPTRRDVRTPEHFVVDGNDPRVIRWEYGPLPGPALVFLMLVEAGIVLMFLYLLQDPLVAALFLLVAGTFGALLLHRVACAALNTTTLSIGRTETSLRTGPVPVPGAAMTIPSTSIEQVFCRRITHVRRNRPDHYTHNVVAKTRDRGEKTLVKGLQRHQALFIEQQLEQQLHITDVPVVGAET